MMESLFLIVVIFAANIRIFPPMVYFERDFCVTLLS